MMDWILEETEMKRNGMEWNGMKPVGANGNSYCSQITLAILGSRPSQQIATLQQLKFWHQDFWKEERGYWNLVPSLIEIKSETSSH